MTSFLGDLSKGLKRLQEVSAELSELELKEVILEQRALLLSAKEEILDLKEEVSALNTELRQVKASRDAELDLMVVEGFKYDRVDGKPRGLPYCPKCEISEEGKLFRLLKRGEENSRCPNCKVNYNASFNGRVHEKTPLPNRTVGYY